MPLAAFSRECASLSERFQLLCVKQFTFQTIKNRIRRLKIPPAGYDRICTVSAPCAYQFVIFDRFKVNIIGKALRSISKRIRKQKFKFHPNLSGFGMRENILHYFLGSFVSCVDAYPGIIRVLHQSLHCTECYN